MPDVAAAAADAAALHCSSVYFIGLSDERSNEAKIAAAAAANSVSKICFFSSFCCWSSSSSFFLLFFCLCSARSSDSALKAHRDQPLSVGR